MSLLGHLDALLLALASSVDNFTVGLAVGIGRKRLPFWANGLISLINALGALVAGFIGGSLLSDFGCATWLSAIAFGTLGMQEIATSSSQGGPKTFSVIDLKQVLRLALPMTLNNLAGGVAGGAKGLQPITTALYALVASFLTMALGYSLGQRLGHKIHFNASLVSGSLLSLLCLFTILEVL